MKQVLVLAAALGVSLAFAGANLVENGKFETVDGKGDAVGWQKGRAWRFAEAGLDGSVGAVFDHPTPTFYGGVQQVVKAATGRCYAFGASVRTENLKGKAVVCLEWYGANGRYIGGRYSQGVGGTKDWTDEIGNTPPLPTNAVKVVLQVYCDHGTTGKAVFDNVWLRERELGLIDGLYSSRYRNAAADGKVTFKAALNLPSGAETSAKGVFTLTDVENPSRPRTLPATLADGVAAVECAVADFAVGEHRIDFTLSGVPGREKATASIAFRRLTPEQERSLTVRIDEHGRTVVNGRPFFPLGMYWNAIDECNVKRYADSPFNCLMPYHAPNRRQMDLCAAHGLKVIYNVVGRDLSNGSPLRRFRDHPALLAWYLNDERPISLRRELTQMRDFTEAYDPNHPGWIVIWQNAEVRDYLPTFDVIGTDPYPLYRWPIGMVTEWTRNTKRGLLGLKPMWQVPQVFDKGAYATNRKIPGICKPPTFDDMRNMAWQCLAGGANGLVFYSYFDLLVMDKTTSFERRWGDVKRIAAEIKSYEPYFLTEEPPPEVCAAPESVACRAWRLNGKTLLAVVNTTREPVTAKVTVGGSTRAVELSATEVRLCEVEKL